MNTGATGAGAGARRNPTIAGLGAVLSTVLVLATVVSLLAAGGFARMADRERSAARAEKLAHEDASRRAKAESIARAEAVQERDGAEKARAAAQVEAYRAKLSETRALRAGHQPNWRNENLANLARMAVMPTSRRDLVELRTEAVATLGEFDVKEVARLEEFRGHASSCDFSPDGRMLATAHAAGGVNLWDVPRRRHLRQILDPAGRSDATGQRAAGCQARGPVPS